MSFKNTFNNKSFIKFLIYILPILQQKVLKEGLLDISELQSNFIAKINDIQSDEKEDDEKITEEKFCS